MFHYLQLFVNVSMEATASRATFHEPLTCQAPFWLKIDLDTLTDKKNVSMRNNG